jgi:hypothetical protein
MTKQWTWTRQSSCSIMAVRPSRRVSRTARKQPGSFLVLSLFTVCQQRQHCRIIPNAVIRSKGDKRTYFGHEMEQCRDYSSLHYRLPFEKVRSGSFHVIWDRRAIFLQQRRVISSIGMHKRLFGTACSPPRS